MFSFNRRVYFFPAMALVLAACGSGPSTDNLKTTRAAVLTGLILQPTYTEAPTAAPSPTETETLFLTPSATRTSTRPPVATEPLCDNSAYVSDVTIPDGTVLEPGEEFEKTWSLRNTGACSWSTAYTIDFVSGDQMDGVAASLPAAVESGGVIEISVGLAAPGTPGTYTGYWRLKNAGGIFFGELVYVQIVVSESATETPASADDTPSATPDITDTPLPTDTETPG
ncbi:MAG: hypothetical protein JW748_02585 [Anaerolineales bacterium]|nr:hypothetical protein [Anaerolineales bacterium]